MEQTQVDKYVVKYLVLLSFGLLAVTLAACLRKLAVEWYGMGNIPGRFHYASQMIFGPLVYVGVLPGVVLLSAEYARRGGYCVAAMMLSSGAAAWLLANFMFWIGALDIL